MIKKYIIYLLEGINMEKRDVVIIGGGSSGVALAINLKKVNPNLKVTLLEQNDKILKKVLKTGNGKCNISNYNICKDYYHNYEHFEKWIDKFENLDIDRIIPTSNICIISAGPPALINGSETPVFGIELVTTAIFIAA